MRSTFRKWLIGAVAAQLVGLLSIAGVAIGQSSIYMPVPSGIFLAKGALVVAQDGNNLTGIAAPAAGQVLTSQGVGALPAWGSPQIGASGTLLTQVTAYSQTFTPASVGAAVCAEQTFTVTGLATTDKVVFNPVATGNATSAAQVRVSATNTLAVTYCNPTAGALTPAAGAGNVLAFRT